MSAAEISNILYYTMAYCYSPTAFSLFINSFGLKNNSPTAIIKSFQKYVITVSVQCPEKSRPFGQLEDINIP